MKIIKSVIFAVVGATLLTTGSPAIQAHASDQVAENNVVESAHKIDGKNPSRIGNTIYSISNQPENYLSEATFSTSLKAKKYKQGVSKVVKKGKYTTIYISKSDAQDIVSGAGIVIGGYTGKSLGVLLGLAGLGTRRAIKGGVWLKTMNITGTDGLTHTVVKSFGWQ